MLDLYLDDLDPSWSPMHGADLPRKLDDPRWIVVLYPNHLHHDARRLLDERYDLVERFPGWADWSNGDVLIYSLGRSVVP